MRGIVSPSIEKAIEYIKALARIDPGRLFLPARTPEWNPIQLLWNCLSMRLKHNDWDDMHCSSRVVHAAIEILDNITHDEVESFYRKSGVFSLHGHA